MKIRKFYSDSKTDIFLAEIAEESYFVKKNKVMRCITDKRLINFNLFFIAGVKDYSDKIMFPMISVFEAK